MEYLNEVVGSIATSGLALLLDLPHEFPTQWHAFTTSASAPLEVEIERDHFPYFAHGRRVDLEEIRLFRLADGELEAITTDVGLEALSEALEEGAMTLSLQADPTVLVRESTAAVFAVLRYSIHG